MNFVLIELSVIEKSLCYGVVHKYRVNNLLYIGHVQI